MSDSPESRPPGSDPDDDVVDDEVPSEPVSAFNHVNSARRDEPSNAGAALPTHDDHEHADSEYSSAGEYAGEPTTEATGEPAAMTAEAPAVESPAPHSVSAEQEAPSDSPAQASTYAEPDRDDLSTYSATDHAEPSAYPTDEAPTTASAATDETTTDETPIDAHGAPTTAHAPADSTPTDAYGTPTAAYAPADATATEPYGAPTTAYAPSDATPTGAYGAPPVPTPPPPAVPIYVAAPPQPRVRGNRLFGLLVVFLGTVLFAVVYALAIAAIQLIRQPHLDVVRSVTRDLRDPAYYFPVIFFFVGAYLLTLILNRASWWLWIFFGFLVGVLVYLSFVAGALISNRVWQLDSANTAALYAQLWLNPFAIVSGVAAREITVWCGAWLAARGRKLKVRNAEARAEYEGALDENNRASYPAPGAFPPAA